MSEKTITVCDNCLCASCWRGFLMCEGAKDAGTVEKTIEELKELNLEHPSYWRDETYKNIANFSKDTNNG